MTENMPGMEISSFLVLEADTSPQNPKQHSLRKRTVLFRNIPIKEGVAWDVSFCVGVNTIEFKDDEHCSLHCVLGWFFHEVYDPFFL